MALQRQPALIQPVNVSLTCVFILNSQLFLLFSHLFFLQDYVVEGFGHYPEK